MDLLRIDVTLPRREFDVRAALTLGSETVALVGPSGAGKTSLLRTIAGLERPHAGRISLGDELWFDAQRKVHLSPERRRLGYLPQDYGLFPHLTVAENVRFAARRDRPDLLERFGIGHLGSARPRQLSGGERQRVGLARALAREPRVLLLDEPFGALDALTRQQVRDELADQLPALDLPTLLVTHAFSDAIVLAERIGVLDTGRLLQLAPAEELLRAPANAMVAALTGANVLGGNATPTATGATVHLDGGGQLTTTASAAGPVQVAVHPWELELTDGDRGPFTDTVISVHQDRGALQIRLTRLTIQVPPGENGRGPVTPGMTVGLKASPANVRVLPDPDGG